MLDDKEGAAALLIQAYEKAPEMKDISERLEALGWTRVGAKWITRAQAAALPPDPSKPADDALHLQNKTRDQVRKALGSPDSVTRVISAGRLNEVWIYKENARSQIAIHFLGNTDGRDLRVVRLVQCRQGGAYNSCRVGRGFARPTNECWSAGNCAALARARDRMCAHVSRNCLEILFEHRVGDPDVLRADAPFRTERSLTACCEHSGDATKASISSARRAAGPRRLDGAPLRLADEVGRKAADLPAVQDMKCPELLDRLLAEAA